jgi:hypothetical protein
MPDFFSKFPAQFACACHRIVKSGKALDGQNPSDLVYKGVEYGSFLNRERFHPFFFMLASSRIKTLINGVYKDMIDAFGYNIHPQDLRIFEYYWAGQIIQGTTESDSFKNLGSYFCNHMFTHPLAGRFSHDIYILEANNKTFDFRNWKFGSERIRR